MGPFLKYLFVGSEPANGIDPGRLNIYNVYAMSESGFDICVFRIDRAYDTCPIGRPQFDKRVYILGEDGGEVPDGETGEFCFDNPFVRGYINLPEQTAAAFPDWTTGLNPENAKPHGKSRNQDARFETPDDASVHLTLQ